MYCPKCFDQSISLNSRGVVEVTINSKQMDTGRFIFYSSEKQKFEGDLRLKIEEFSKWYGGFNNPETIKSFELTTADYKCSSGCPFSPTEKISVFDLLIPHKKAVEILKEIAGKYDLDIAL